MEGYFGAGQAITPGWYPNPAGRFEQRYWNGAAWTEQVASGGVPGYDPLPPAPPAIQQQPVYGGAPGQPPPYAAVPVPPPYTGAPGQPFAYGVAGAATRSTRRIAGSLVGLAGGAVVIAATYMDWLSGGGMSISGWDLYDMRSNLNENVFYVGDMFGSGSPFFTGLTTLILGIAVVVVALLVLAVAATQRPGSSGGAGGALALLGTLVAGLASFATAMNLAVWIAKGNDQGGVDAAAGLFVVFAGSVVAMMALGAAVRR
jgi:hypothetical protein